MITIEQLKDVQSRAEKLKQYLAIDEKRIQLEEEELHTQAPGFWDAPPISRYCLFSFQARFLCQLPYNPQKTSAICGNGK